MNGKKILTLQKLNNSTKIIVVTGAESTGKSTLTEFLAKHFNAPFSSEFARDYVEKIDRNYTFEDVEIIAKKQVELVNQLKRTNSPFIFTDTWLIITKIWFEVVFKKVPSWLDKEIKSTHIDLFLVCDTDIPWIPDNVRENGGENRLLLQKRYIEEIEHYGFNYKIISGKNKIRNENAINCLNFLL